MKAINIPYHVAEEIEKLENSALISISSGLENRPNLKVSGPQVLSVDFPDITAPFKYKGVDFDPLLKGTAQKMLDFINSNLGKNFIVHCHAGVSRSSAVCLYLNIVHGYELKENFWQTSHPNPYVLGQLFITSKYKKV